MPNTKHLSWFERLSHLLLREPHSQKQLISILRDAQKRELIDRDALQMIEGVLTVSVKKVRDIMVPRPQMVMVDGDAKPLDILPTIIQSQHSRFPVMADTPDKILGILLAKDVLPFTMSSTPNDRFVRDLIRPSVFIPETKPLDILLKEFRLNRNHMAIVVDEYGSVSGLVTIEDVLEEIVGDIQDEYDIDDKETTIKELEKNIFLVNALTSINDFNRYFKTHFDDEDFETIGGLVLRKLGHLPKRNEKIILGHFEMMVLKSTRRGIQMLQVKRMRS